MVISDAQKPAAVADSPAYNLLIAECKKRGIGRTTAFRLAKERLIDTFLIGRRRYVLIASLDSLPARLRQSEWVTPSALAESK